MKLNQEQTLAIRHKRGPLLILAGAGTGKTTVITERIKHLIITKIVGPSEILGLTFTEKAAREMEERVDQAMPYGYTQMWISTFHGFCDRVLRAEALHIGLDPRFKLMAESEAVQFVRNNLFQFKLHYFRPLGNPTKFVSGMLQHFSRLQDEDVSPNQYFCWAKSQISDSKSQSKEEKIEKEKWLELASAYKSYAEFKTKEGLMDFGDLITNALELFRKRPNILAQYQKQFQFVLVDEFQDTNFSQNELAIMLAGKNKNITVTGDDDQSVYRFRGAAVSNILQFKKHFPKAKIVTLTKNYRSTQEILDKAYNLIGHNNPDRLEAIEKVDKHLVSQRSVKGEKIHFLHQDRVENEADVVAKKIHELTKKNFKFGDIAILVRANAHAEPFVRALQRQAIPYQFLGPGRLFKQSEVLDLIAYLKVLYNFEDSVAFYRLLSLDYFDLLPRDLAKLGNFARANNLSLFEACERVEEIFISQNSKQKITKILTLINSHLKLVRKETAGQLLYNFLEDSGLIQKLVNPDSPEAQKQAQNISKFFDKLKTYEVDHEDATVPAVVDWLELASELGESPLAADSDWTEINAVNILTVHSSKGLEFPVVFLVNLVAQRFPTIQRRELIPIPDRLVKEVLPQGDYHLQEERRLFYVGMTRAQDLLFFTAANYYGEAKREKKLSPFIFEALGDEVVASEQLETKAKQLTFLDYQQTKAPTVITSQLLHLDYLSYSQIETFRTCPLHYKLKYILKIPTPPSAALSFGISMHEALKDFYVLLRLGKKPTKRLLFNCLKEAWVKKGYTSQAHEKKMFDRGQSYLTGYFRKGFDPKAKIALVEKPFVFPLVSQNQKLKIGGKIDRIDLLSSGKVEIVDYKTGANIPTQQQVDHDLQLTIYALAATNIRETPFNKSPKDVVLTLYYFDNQKKLSTTRTKEELENAKKEILKIKREIETSEFKCSKSILCKTCEYSFLCQED